MRTTIAVTLAVSTSLLLAACGAEDDVATTPGATTELTVTVRSSPEATPRAFTLTCEPPGGTHPSAAAACAAIESAADPFAAPPRNETCTQQYGGPQTATVTGTYRGERVQATFARNHGCAIARWEALSAVLSPAGEWQPR